jgi:hypothetical protein
MEQEPQNTLGERVFWRHMRVLRMPLMGRVVLRRLPMLESVQRRWARSSMLPDIWSAPIYAGWPFEYGRPAPNRNTRQASSIAPAQVRPGAPAAAPTASHPRTTNAVDAQIVHASRLNPSGTNPSRNHTSATDFRNHTSAIDQEANPQPTPLPRAAQDLSIAGAEHSLSVPNVPVSPEPRRTYMQRPIRQSRRATPPALRTELAPIAALETVVPASSRSRARESETAAAQSPQPEPSTTAEEPPAVTRSVELTSDFNRPVDSLQTDNSPVNASAAPVNISAAAPVNASAAPVLPAIVHLQARTGTSPATEHRITDQPPGAEAAGGNAQRSPSAATLSAQPQAPNPETATAPHETATPGDHNSPVPPLVVSAHSASSSSPMTPSGSAITSSSSAIDGLPEMQHLVVAPNTDNTSQSAVAPLATRSDSFAQIASQSPAVTSSAPEPPVHPPATAAPASALPAATPVVSASMIESPAAPFPVVPVFLQSPATPQAPLAQPHIAPVATAPAQAPTGSLESSSQRAALSASPVTPTPARLGRPLSAAPVIPVNVSPASPVNVTPASPVNVTPAAPVNASPTAPVNASAPALLPAVVHLETRTGTSPATAHRITDQPSSAEVAGGDTQRSPSPATLSAQPQAPNPETATAPHQTTTPGDHNSPVSPQLVSAHSAFSSSAIASSSSAITSSSPAINGPPEMQHLVIAPHMSTSQSPAAPLDARPDSIAQIASQSPPAAVTSSALEPPVHPPAAAAPSSALSTATPVVSASIIESIAAPVPAIPVYLQSPASPQAPFAQPHIVPVATAPPRAPTGSLERSSQRAAVSASPLTPGPGRITTRPIDLDSTTGGMSEAIAALARYRNHRGNSLSTSVSPARQQTEAPAASSVTYSASESPVASLPAIHSQGISRSANFAVSANSEEAAASPALVHLHPAPFAALRMHQGSNTHPLPPFAPHSADGNIHSHGGYPVSRASLAQHTLFPAGHTPLQRELALPSMTSAALAPQSPGPSPISMREPDVRVLADKVYQMLIMRLNRERDRRGGANGIS